jgi:hypothetical protein
MFFNDFDSASWATWRPPLGFVTIVLYYIVDSIDPVQMPPFLQMDNVVAITDGELFVVWYLATAVKTWQV